MALNKDYLLPRVLLGLMVLVRLTATIPTYAHPTSNSGLINLVDPALPLGATARAFLGRQLTVKKTKSTLVSISAILPAFPRAFSFSRASPA